MSAKTPAELEKQMLDVENWHRAPHPIYEIAEVASKEGVFTGIAWDDYYGWTILQRDNTGPRIAWSERNFQTDTYGSCEDEGCPFD